MKDLSSILMHEGENPPDYFNAVCPPIIQSSNFRFKSIEDFRNAITNEVDEVIYTRGNNPTVNILRRKIAALEKCEDALVFGSGTAAIAATLIAHLQAGDHIVCVEHPYAWTKTILTQFFSKFKVEHTFVKGESIEAIKAALRPETRILYLESPNSVTFELQDLSACAALARQHDILTIIDNSYASPIYQNPKDYGIDLIIHSGTKYLNGHSDVVFGTVSGDKHLIEKIFHETYMTLGAILSPHDAALAIRGLRTLPLRMQQSHKTALYLAQTLEKHPKVEKVLHPFLDSFPQQALAKRQMRACGGLFSILLKADSIAEVENFFNRLKRFTLAVSWGGHESLVLPFCAFYQLKDRAKPAVPWNLVRIYAGLEEAEWLKEDLLQALN